MVVMQLQGMPKRYWHVVKKHTKNKTSWQLSLLKIEPAISRQSKLVGLQYVL
jgi:hypothetical protein